jgi:tetratricopeptide (TPR) repeat protein
MANIIRWGLTDGFRLAQTVGKELDNAPNATPEEFVAAAERAKKKYPGEWVIYYTLADKYQQLGYYPEALLATQKCVEIRPKDIRSVYALATSYNLITRAAWSDKEDEVASLLELFFGDKGPIDKRLSQGAIDRTGLTVETAAVQAIRWFENALTLNPDSQSKTQLQMDLQTLYVRFPHLKR